MLRTAHASLSRFLLAPLLATFMLLVLTPFNGVEAHSTPQQEFSFSFGKHYLALGDSLAFGFQPDGDFIDGYADYFARAHAVTRQGIMSYANEGCPGETTSTLINGECPHPEMRKYPYQGSQLAAALDYINNWGPVSVVTLSIGANDLLPKINPATCMIDEAGFTASLKTLDTNLTTVILPQLSRALKKSHGKLLVTNAYNPFQNICPQSNAYIKVFNEHLSHDVRGYGKLVDVYSAFGGVRTPNSHLCNLTWMCASSPDIHPNDKGYKLIADLLAKEY
ncbi:SGNH/GDSL hydrolase family protein [Ktedonospora formicarum]|uniref:SGNH hydrolase-type esterase domain-containing protein n=1 Tax=Ktedonospora formicarum TaxID=2778364 RepID=A0A8J3HY62_9CHLR|nr:SGNH/GDSL hydrolase family protein [Ktedonospora formicarum]GHO46367.1 hypothetical protein KSX_45300 [Ktedonospora formicarum]